MTVPLAITVAAVCAVTAMVGAQPALAANAVSGSTSAPASSSCGDAVFLAVPGNGEAVKTPTNLYVSRELKALYQGMESTAGTRQISYRVIDNPTPSVDRVTAGLDKIQTTSSGNYAAAAKAKLMSNLGRYILHADDGLAALRAEYANVQTECGPATPIVLGGYSQGAMVVHEFVNELATSNDEAAMSEILGVVLIADPERVAQSAVPETSTSVPGSSGACDLERTALNCADPAQVTDINPVFRARTVNICSAGDAACDTSTVLTQLVGQWPSRGQQTVTLNQSTKIHGGYAALPATRSMGQMIGALMATH